MNTTLKSMLPGTVLLFAQAPIAGAILLAAPAAARHWDELLERRALPLLTQWALDSGILIPAVAAALSLIVLAVGWRRKSPGHGLLFTISACEVLALALFVLALILPGMDLGYH